ncbi:TraR/DksA C4-type zinc finger protein [Actinoplanes sp. NPDC051411]|jgi:RNA polymerase-binding transcription factor DksA|uniref:TraR/DksA family transcriptional regulator n=1 Tax=Actinoplanes sp. NPDC051411 TaxID=3155522 RepID=UPI00341F6B55
MTTRESLERLLADAEAESGALERDLASVFEASRSSNADDEHDPEGATIAFERAQLTATLAATRQRAAELRAALVRHDEGGYGICERCGRPIPAARLEVRPDARTCVTCA